MTLYVRDVPEDLHRRFKAYAATRGESIRAALLRLMAEALKKGGART